MSCIYFVIFHFTELVYGFLMYLDRHVFGVLYVLNGIACKRNIYINKREKEAMKSFSFYVQCKSLPDHNTHFI